MRMTPNISAQNKLGALSKQIPALMASIEKNYKFIGEKIMFILCASPKGGTGKSLMASLILDTLIWQGKQPVVIDADIVPSVAAAYEQEINAFSFPLASEEDLDRVRHIVTESKGRPIVLNTAPGRLDLLQAFGTRLRNIEQNFLCVWPINIHVVCVEQLEACLPMLGAENIQVVKNGFFGNSFPHFDAIADKLPRPAYFLPKEETNSINLLDDNDKTLSQYASVLRMGERIFFEQWLKDARNSLSSILEKSSQK